MIKTFIISFEVPNGTNLSDFYNALKGYGHWARLTEHTWAIVTDQKAKDVRDYLVGFLPSGSRLLVVKSGSVSAWRNLICSTEWLRNNL